MESTRAFYECMRVKDFEQAEEMMQHDGNIVHKIGYSSITCAGSYGMPLWKHFGDFLQEKSYADERAKDFARIMAKVTTQGDDNRDETYLILLCNYALSANWIDVVEDCISQGLGFENKAIFLEKGRVSTIEMSKVFDNWMKEPAAAAEVIKGESKGYDDDDMPDLVDC